MKAFLSASCLFLAGVTLASCGAREVAGAYGDAPADRSIENARAPAGGEQGPKASVDEPLEDYQRNLLDLAFEAASKFPMYPHEKNRARAQSIVANAALQLGNATLAVGYAPRINGWRRGAVYADYAWHCARRGKTEGLERYLELARKVIAEVEADENAQGWRADTVRLSIARAYEAMNQPLQAQQAARGIADGSGDAVNQDWSAAVADRAAKMSKAAAVAEIERKERMLIDNSESLGDQNTSLTLLARLHGVHFAEPEVRAPIEERVLDAYVKIPPEIRLHATAIVIENCIEHGDNDAAERLIGASMELIRSLAWQPRNRIPQVARFVTLRAKAGDAVRARAETEAMLAEYHEKTRDELEDMHRCEVLREIALCWQALGETEQAEGLLAQAFEEGVENPNSRPRCFDFVETCAAMALHRVPPSAVLWERLREICDGLGDPW